MAALFKGTNNAFFCMTRDFISPRRKNFIVLPSNMDAMKPLAILSLIFCELFNMLKENSLNVHNCFIGFKSTS